MKYKTIIWNFLKKISNLNFSIFLLLLISLISILGTIIEQDESIDYYKKNYPIHEMKLIEINWEIIQRFKLNQLYTNWFFIALLMIFCLSLITCTLSTQLPSLKHARRWKFKKQISVKNTLWQYPTPIIISPSSIIYFLNRTNYHAFHQEYYIYSYKGLLGRLAPICVHVSLVSILGGSLLGLFTGISFQEMIPVGEVFHLKNIIKSGLISSIPDDLIGKINTFTIEYNTNQSIKQFYSNISILNKKKQVIKNQTISVNKPLYFKEFTFYQTNWQINGLKLKINNKYEIQVPIKKIINNNTVLWLTTFYYNNEDVISLVISGLKEPIVYYDKTGQLLQTVTIGEMQTVHNIPIQITEIITSTGLQIKKDPGVLIIYLSFFTLMLSILISYTSYSQLWIIHSNNTIQIFGLTNRAELNFEEDTLKLQNMLSMLY
uniref:Cytochrome c biogenesis protein Ccs1 n=1 Tax=Sheathia arcuata TaxID=340433 RepID=A0A3G1I8X2_9FLOR|nr:c-type cytochrome biogenesis protein [Sheathia arcuata]ART65390.1 c-type cytochrome biogenesis protein [Sheathia arcuata]